MGKAKNNYKSNKRTKRAATMRKIREDRDAETDNIHKYCVGIIDDILENVFRKVCEVEHTQVAEKKHEDEDWEDLHNFTLVSNEEYERINEHILEVEVEEYRPQLDGFRIVDIDYFIRKCMNLQSDHNKKCTGGNLILESEKRCGLSSKFTFVCSACDKKFTITNEKLADEKKILNKAAVWGTLASGGTFSHLKELLSCLDIPSISGNMFFEIQRNLGPIWKEYLLNIMEEAGRQERECAIQNGDVDPDGIPFITVLVDGGWSKRSYGHSYNANSGVAVIIGKRTKKLLFIGIRNKYCSVCARAENKQESPGEHMCFKNWQGSATSMESDIVVEGFNNSIKMHQLRYKHFIADGDSTVLSKIRKNVVYGSEVTKTECTNHCIKNYSKHLFGIKKDTKRVSLQARKMLTSDIISKLSKAAQKAIYVNANGDIDTLKADIRNSVFHVFGNHAQCKIHFCETVGDTSSDKTELLKSSGLHHHVYAALNLLIIKSPLLIQNETSNLAEQYMNILARFNMGKRLNLIQRDSFETRSYLTGLRYNKGSSWHTMAWKKCFNKSPGKNLRKFVESGEKKSQKRKADMKVRARKRLKFTPHPQQDDDNIVDYGPNISEVEMSEDDLQEEITKLTDRLQVTDDERQNIEVTTRGQFLNQKYITEKMYRLTASNFGLVIKRKPHTSCDVLVKSILDRKDFSTAATEYGLVNEQVAIGKFMELSRKTVRPSGLFVHKEYGFLGASPDGIISEEEIIEVKCLYKAATSGLPLKEFVKQKKVPCLTINENDEVCLNRKHNYYYQIQGQLAITESTACYFIVFTGEKNELFIESIPFDVLNWNNQWLPKLKNFYMHCLAPEIILNRRGRNLKCKDPHYIVEAKAQLNQKKQKKIERKGKEKN